MGGAGQAFRRDRRVSHVPLPSGRHWTRNARPRPVGGPPRRRRASIRERRLAGSGAAVRAYVRPAAIPRTRTSRGGGWLPERLGDARRIVHWCEVSLAICDFFPPLRRILSTHEPPSRLRPPRGAALEKNRGKIVCVPRRRRYRACKFPTSSSLIEARRAVQGPSRPLLWRCGIVWKKPDIEKPGLGNR